MEENKECPICGTINDHCHSAYCIGNYNDEAVGIIEEYNCDQYWSMSENLLKKIKEYRDK